MHDRETCDFFHSPTFSASMGLLRQSGESLAGRIEYVDMNPLDVLEIDPEPAALTYLWVRVGFPDNFLAAGDADSLTLRQNFIRTYSNAVS